jgi:autotransporter-associated beta strand protein
VTTSLVLGNSAGVSGIYNLSGSGVVSSNNTYVGLAGTGTFNQTGGTHTTNNALVLGNSAGSTGTYNLSAGTFVTGGISRGTGTGTFNFNGGTLRANQSNTSFITGLTTANVQAGGAKIDSNGFNITIAQVLAHDSAGPASDGGLTKSGSGALTLGGVNTYTGATTVNAGSLFVNGSTISASAVTVNNSGSMLGGTGSINGAVNIASSGANLCVGASGSGNTAILRTGALTLSSGANFVVDLNNTTAGTGYDQLSVTGTVSLSGTNIVVTAGSGLTIGDKFFVALNDGTDSITGTFAQNTTVAASNGDIFTINYADNGDSGTLGNDVSLTFTAVPEPRTFLPGILGFVTIAGEVVRRFCVRNVIR